MVAEHEKSNFKKVARCSLAKISMVAELIFLRILQALGCSLAKISMVAEHSHCES